MSNERWYKDEDENSVWWLDNGDEIRGVFIFSFDKKKKYNLFSDYPNRLTGEERRTFDREYPFWKDFFKDRG